MDKLSIIVPCYNEEDVLSIFYKEINSVSKKMKNVNFEFFFINDGSNDKTLDIIKKIYQKDKRVHYISFSRNFGKEAGIYAGLEHADGNYVAIMDADMQDPPNMIKTMYEIIKNEDYDCVALCSKEHNDYSFLRKTLTRLWYKLISKNSSIGIVAGARDFRLMKRKMVNAIISMKEYNRYSKGIFNFVGFNTKWLEYEIPNRVAGKTKWSIFKLFRYAFEGVIAFSTRPLIISAFIGILFCLIAFIAIIFIIVKTLVWGDPVGGWPSLACLIIFMGGIQLFFFGIMGMYLSKTYLEVKKRPIYVISEKDSDKL